MQVKKVEENASTTQTNSHKQLKTTNPRTSAEPIGFRF